MGETWSDAPSGGEPLVTLNTLHTSMESEDSAKTLLGCRSRLIRSNMFPLGITLLRSMESSESCWVLNQLFLEVAGVGTEDMSGGLHALLVIDGRRE